MKLNRLIGVCTLALYLLGIAGSAAEVITPDEAREIAGAFNRTNTKMRNASSPQTLTLKYFEAASQGNAFYVFAPISGRGYTIVSGNDVAAPVIGYSETGVFDAASIPCNMRMMLNLYKEQINYAIANNLPTYDASSQREANDMPDIAPVCKTLWDQDAPYNNLCPTQYGSRTYTGCVATAMAQAMYVFKWPIQSTGSATWNNSTVSFNRKYDWDNMLLNYSNGYTTAQGTAVAELMVDCGKSVDMDYGTNGSGAVTDVVPVAMYNNFNYDKSISYSQSNMYSDTAWKEMMYYQLSQGWPIIYGGFADDNSGGHQFICDGYRSGGYFHINWGWSGMSDGYFLLNALDPYAQGAGGSSGAGFNTYTDAVYNIHKPMSGTEQQTDIVCLGNFVVGSSTSSSATFKVTSGSLWGQSYNAFANLGGFDVTAVMGIRCINVDDPTKVYDLTSTANAKTFYKWSTLLSSYTVNISSLPAGKYYVFPISKASGKTTWQRVKCPGTRQNYQILTRSGSSNAFSAPTSPVFKPMEFAYLPDTVSITKGDTRTLKPFIIPSDCTYPNMEWSSSNPDVVAVDQSGIITGITKGDAIVTCTSKDGFGVSASIKVAVAGINGIDEIALGENKEYDVYTTTGILVLRKASLERINQLPKGIYIVGNKKMVIR